MRHVLLLRGVNVGKANRVAMADLRALLEQLGHTDVRTVLNSGNATFDGPQRAAGEMADEIERGLRDRLHVDVRAWVGTGQKLQRVLDEAPDLPGYLTCNILFDLPDPAALTALLSTDWSPEHVAGTPRCVYVGYDNAGTTKLTNAKLEKVLGVSLTARTPATLAKLLPAALRTP